MTEGFGFIQVLILFFGYGYILFLGSNMISDGSELLLLVPSLKGSPKSSLSDTISTGIVGSIVLPVLGAVPDGAIILFSGLGDDAQNQVKLSWDQQLLIVSGCGWCWCSGWLNHHAAHGAMVSFGFCRKSGTRFFWHPVL